MAASAINDPELASPFGTQIGFNLTRVNQTNRQRMKMKMKCRDGSVNKGLSLFIIIIYFTAINTGIKFGKNSPYK